MSSPGFGPQSPAPADQSEHDEPAQPAPKARKNRVRINRDHEDVPVVRDETGEKVTELFQAFLEQ